MFQGGVSELTASSLPQSLAERVRDEPGVADATPIAVATGELRGAPSFLVFGVEPDSFVFRSLVLVAGRSPGPPTRRSSATRRHASTASTSATG
jgi:hypothetical protein